MLQKGKPTPQLQAWLDKLPPVVARARVTLRQTEPHKLALRSGCRRDEDGSFGLDFFWKPYTITGDAFTVHRAGTGDPAPSFIQSLILTYMATADGTTPSGRWIGFRELPDGMFYTQAFEGYSGKRLVRELEPRGGIEALRRSAGALACEPLTSIGDAGYVFTVLPRLHLALVYWEGDDEFPSQARVLFEDTADHYMPTDGLAILGSQLVGKILKASR